jgi:g-D-glutamyl-meso-diaminopimelate peptidase
MYTYNDLLSDLACFRDLGAKIGYIGSTAAGRMIPYIHSGSHRGPQIIVQGAIHAREHITAALVSRQIERSLLILRQRREQDEETKGFLGLDCTPCTSRSKNTKLTKHCDAYMPQGGGIYFIPMVNIDGACLAQFGLESVRDRGQRNFLRRANCGSDDFSAWKANINAVDLNVNFCAEWGSGAQNVRFPASANFVGPYPVSEPETRALTAFTRKICPAATLSYHCTGREIYWEFGQEGERRKRDKNIGKKLAEVTGYALIDGKLNSAGGYKDWCVKELKIPAYTIEILPEAKSYPVSYEGLDEERERNKDVPEILLRGVL